MKIKLLAMALIFVFSVKFYFVIVDYRAKNRRDSIDGLTVTSSTAGNFKALNARWVGEIPNSFCKIEIFIVNSAVDINYFDYNHNKIFESGCTFLPFRNQENGKVEPSPRLTWVSDNQLRVEYSVGDKEDTAHLSGLDRDLAKELTINFVPFD